MLSEEADRLTALRVLGSSISVILPFKPENGYVGREGWLRRVLSMATMAPLRLALYR